MNEKIHEFKTRLSELDLLSALTTWREDRDAMLQCRDGEPFDAAWMRAYNAVEEVEQGLELQAESETAIDELREATFLKALDKIGDNELAAYVADDFDLLARAVAAGYSDTWLDWLWAEYQAGRFPHALPTAGTPKVL